MNEQKYLLEISQDKPGHFRKECLNFYLSATTYLLNRLPFHVSILERCTISSPMPKKRIGCHQCHLQLSFFSDLCVEQLLCEVFDVKAPVTRKEIGDKI